VSRPCSDGWYNIEINRSCFIEVNYDIFLEELRKNVKISVGVSVAPNEIQTNLLPKKSRFLPLL
jgi:hypothetical protein